MRIGLVVNPVSGGGRGRKAGGTAFNALRQDGCDVTVIETAAPGDATRIATRLAEEGFELVIALGGDGTASEVVNGLMKARDAGAALPDFGFVAAGTGMDFRRNFSLPTDPAAAARAVISATATPVDVGEVSFIRPDGTPGQRYFLNVASIGLSGVIAASVNAAKARGSRAGASLYFLHSVREILRYRGERLTVQVDDDQPIEAEIGVVAVANGGWFGGGMPVAPDADPRDGVLNIVIMTSHSRLKTLGHLIQLSTGRHRNSRSIQFLRGRSVRIAAAFSSSGSSVVLEMDGETMQDLPAYYRILPGALMLRA